jgi:glutamate/tyrosine decarboxylase-like PLP-dependent enzyme
MPSNHQLDVTTLPLLAEALSRLEAGFTTLPGASQPASASPGRLRAVLDEVADRLRDNFPYFHPLYAGQMLKPPHAVARLAYALAMWINPNNHALDGGRASSAMELEAVAALARMFGWDQHLGHLTGGGTMANLEALWVAGQLRPGTAVVASSQAHYTHGRISAVLGLPFQSVTVDAGGRMKVGALEQVLEREQVGTVVATVGTTGLGAVDPIPALLALREKFGFRLHADAAYGGYFGLAGNIGPATRAAYDALGEVDSIVIDPHKHGLQPYGSGSVLFRDPSVGRFYRHDSPYTYFTSAELHLGEISLECSRPGAAAVALWATQRLLPLKRGGEFAAMLEQCRAAALSLYARLKDDPRFLAPLEPELDIVVWAIRAATASEASRRARQVFEAAARRGLHLALSEMPVTMLDPAGSALSADRPNVTCLRSVLMKPEHAEWVPAIWEILESAVSSER